ncbi:MAG: UDP-N-acetylmuramoyl-L-alanyl-D-glutamate--2,6-diaminopimelate ligase [Solobacterium sp.]|nr:UDP-N-acetylmuramoyl-L-alanyl-D-glutamate--2,6-diaminopimelate ligase [Solobacterium sp.]
MKLTELFENVPDIEVKCLTADSRKKRPDSIFFCVKGMKYDGHNFVDEAISNGAKVVVHSEPIPNMKDDVTYIRVRDVMTAYNKVADAFYHYPSHKLLMVGVTGSYGKSSVACIIRDILNEFQPTGYIGTMDIEYGSVKLPPVPASPDIDDLHGILRDMVDTGMKSSIVEVSSIGIEQNRYDSIDFDVAVFTNLSSDHLDYHLTVANYIQAKKRLFDGLKPEAVAVVNADDPVSRQMVQDCRCKVITYGIDQEADYRAVSYQLLKDRSRMTLSISGMEYELETNLIAKFNIYNLLAAIAALHVKGIPIEQMKPFINDLRQIDGRMERIIDGQPFNILVDLANSPDGIEQVCQYASAITPKGKRIIALTGSSGKKDVVRRPLIGKVLDKYCDMIILTEDDPASEDPADIAREIAAGIRSTNCITIEDRENAIRQAIELADINDTVLLLGKGNSRTIFRNFGPEEYEGDDVLVHNILKKYYFTDGDEEVL